MGADFDFLTPFMKAAIITDPTNPDFTRFPLWTFTDPKGQKLATRPELWGESYGALTSLSFLESITVKLGLAYVPTITATLTPPLEDARRFVESPLIEWTRSILEVQYGYVGAGGVVSSPTFEGVIQKPEVTLGSDVSVNLTAQGVGGIRGMQEEGTGEPKTDTSLEEVFREICTRNGMELDTSELEKGNAWEEMAALTDNQPSILQGNVGDWWFLVREARKIGCWVLLDSTKEARGGGTTSKLKLFPINSVADSTPKLKFKLFDFTPKGVVGPKNGVYPILSFSTPTSAVYLAGATQKIRAAGIDSKTREAKEITADDATSKPSHTGNGQSGLVSQQSGGSFLGGVDGAAPDAQQVADNEFKAAIGGRGVKIEVQTVGIPTLVPGQIIEIAGISPKRIDGLYIVFEVTHTLGTGGYDTSFVAYTNVAQLTTRPGAGIEQQGNVQRLNDNDPASAVTNTSTVAVMPKIQV